MKWFPDRPGLATGLAIMGFGGGALIGAPLGQELMGFFRSPATTGVAETFLVMAVVYACFMVFGAATVRVPAKGWRPEHAQPQNHVATEARFAVGVDRAWTTPQFWLLWCVLALNVTAGIEILGQASLMCQDMFGVNATVGAGFAGLLSIFNMGGRFLWSSLSDKTGRKAIYCVYFLTGAALYAVLPWTQRTGQHTLFVGVTALIISMYGGGFATIPAYLRDVFGTHQVGAIHGRLITAWSFAALVGPQLVNYLSTARKAAGVPNSEAYHPTLYLMSGVLVIGCICNLLIRPVDVRHHLKEGAVV